MPALSWRAPRFLAPVDVPPPLTPLSSSVCPTGRAVAALSASRSRCDCRFYPEVPLSMYPPVAERGRLKNQIHQKKMSY